MKLSSLVVLVGTVIAVNGSSNSGVRGGRTIKIDVILDIFDRRGLNHGSSAVPPPSTEEEVTPTEAPNTEPDHVTSGFGDVTPREEDEPTTSPTASPTDTPSASPTSSYVDCPDGTQCLHGSTCVENPFLQGGYVCDCQAIELPNVYAGAQCEFQATSFCNYLERPSNTHFCTNGGECSEITTVLDDFAGCDCPEGLEGAHCQFVTTDGQEEDDDPPAGGSEGVTIPGNEDGDILSVDSSVKCPDGTQCLHGSTCANNPHRPGRYICNCGAIELPDVYAGVQCEFKVTSFCNYINGYTKTHFCVNEGVCKEIGFVFEEFTGCECPEGLQGTHCQFVSYTEGQEVLPAVTSSPTEAPTTSPSETPSVPPTISTVECPDGRQCLHGSTCVEFQPGQYVCDCDAIELPNVYAGTQCEFEATSFCNYIQGDTKTHFCVNDGVCKEIGYVFDDFAGCDCLEGWEGIHCQFVAPSVAPTEIVECPDGKQCLHGSTCEENPFQPGQYVCDCGAIELPNVYAGTQCEFEATSFCNYRDRPTNTHFCVNDGVCKEIGYVFNDFAGCHCLEGWEGTHCQFEQTDLQEGVAPTAAPTDTPTNAPTNYPTLAPSVSLRPTDVPSTLPSLAPTITIASGEGDGKGTKSSKGTTGGESGATTEDGVSTFAPSASLAPTYDPSTSLAPTVLAGGDEDGKGTKGTKSPKDMAGGEIGAEFTPPTTLPTLGPSESPAPTSINSESPTDVPSESPSEMPKEVPTPI